MDVATISTAVAAISVVVGVIFAIFQMRDAAKTRHTGLIIQLNPALKVTMSEVIEYVSKIWNSRTIKNIWKTMVTRCRIKRFTQLRGTMMGLDFCCTNDS